jgi:L-ascorbate metabolism protein UlaG (beta-lactamase superfamily)
MSSGTELLWYGQSAFKVTTPSGKVLLVDPWIRNPLNPNGEADVAALDQVDLILITHGHFDHMADATEIAQKTGAKLVSTLDLGKSLVAYANYPEELVGFDTQGNFGGELSLLEDEVKVAFIPAVHSSTIASDGSPANFAGNPGGFLISITDGPSIYHTGDTDLFSDMSLIPNFRDVDVMLTCIGGQFTMGPDRAAEAVKLVEPKMVIPMHYGVFTLPGTPEEFAAALEEVDSDAELKVMQVGETLML